MQEQTQPNIVLTPREFVQWLTGFSEGIGEDKAPTVEQWQLVKLKAKSIIPERINLHPGAIPREFRPVEVTSTPSIPPKYTNTPEITLSDTEQAQTPLSLGPRNTPTSFDLHRQ